MLNRLAVKPGDKIGILSTARWIEKSELQFADQLFRSWNLNPVYGKSISAQHGQFAGDDQLRAKNLQQFLDDPEIRAIICARGGYGTIRIMDKIDFTGFMQNPKFICGYSDMTVLFSHITDKLGLPVIHSAMPFAFAKNTAISLESLKNALFGIAPEYIIPSNSNNIYGESRGVLIGGNLSILNSLLGTKFGFSSAGKILFMEDIDEYLYHIDRMMWSLKLAGKLDNLKGLVVGGMTDMKDNQVPFGRSVEEIILDQLRDHNIPVCFGFPAGHQDDNRAIYLGREVLLKTDKEQSLLKYI